MSTKNIITAANIVKVGVIIFSLIVSGCANTSITQVWTQQDLPVQRSYKHPMVLVISDSQQTRRIYEDSLVAELRDEGVSASPSYLWVDDRQKINRDTIDAAVQKANRDEDEKLLIDSVLISYLAVVDTELTLQDSPLSETYSGDAGDNMLSSTLIVGRGRFNTKEVIPLKNDVYDVHEQTIVWSVHTETDDLSTIDALVVDVTEILAAKLIEDGVFQ